MALRRKIKLYNFDVIIMKHQESQRKDDSEKICRDGVIQYMDFLCDASHGSDNRSSDNPEILQIHDGESGLISGLPILRARKVHEQKGDAEEAVLVDIEFVHQWKCRRDTQE